MTASARSLLERQAWRVEEVYICRELDSIAWWIAAASEESEMKRTSVEEVMHEVNHKGPRSGL